MKNIFTKALLIASMTLFSVLPVAAQALGTSCENPYIVTKEFNTAISEPGSYWFSATTYDLPLRVRYTPSAPTDEVMKAYVDFSCTPGVYDDPNLYELTDMASGWNVEMPITFSADTIEVDGQVVYEVLVEAMYRDLMRSFDILYNVEAKVNVYIPQAGAVAVIPDTIFRDCIESSHWITLADTMSIGLTTIDDTYILPMRDWQNDSIYFEWGGTTSPVHIYVSATSCDFVPSDDNVFVTSHIVLDPTNGTQYLSMTSQEIHNFVKDNGNGGLYYARIFSAEEAELVVNYKPLSPEMARAIPMELNKAVEVKDNDMDQYYYFRKDWSENSILFQSTTSDTIIAYFGTTPTFTLDASDAAYIGAYTFYPEAGHTSLCLSKKQLSEMANKCATDHIFVRFAVPKNTFVTPFLWSAGICTSNSVEIFPNGVVKLAANKKNDVYRIDFDKWSMGDTEVIWKGSATNKVYLADTCSYTLSASNSHVITVTTLKKNQSFVITKQLLDSIADRVDAEGYLYFRFDTRGAGELQTVFTLDTTAIVIPDLPAVPTTECSLSSLPLVQGDQVVLNLDSAFTVYRIDYKAWLKSGATLTWNGAEALHTFVAETCTFALAPYNRYVLAYIPVPAQGNIVLDANQLAAMEEYVSEDGFLYIRFLTKEEGVLEVK